MVKITLSLLSVAAIVATVVSASPYRHEGFYSHSRSNVYQGDNGCVPGVTLKEYRPFNLKSYNLKSLISKEIDDDIIVGGVNGNKDFQQLELCIVSSDYDCSTTIISNCIYQNVEYKFRVNAPVQGYLQVVGNEVTIVDSFQEASGLNLYKGEPNWALRVAHFDNNNVAQVFSAAKAGDPIVLEEVVSNKYSQWMEIEEITDFKKEVRHRFW
ncbi:MAG: hypothetical protein BYD32DRAFT_422750 [Podila humilis]|nr:MAG: hypothetical protein BYD32DRAFT_422745 [Podila humilis]KAI9234775.1 MAG: hypothetical protein BYD32DRAFT_422750 [Podila humilis]